MKETIVLWCNEYKRQDVLDALEIVGYKLDEPTDEKILREFNKLSEEEYDEVQTLLGL